MSDLFLIFIIWKGQHQRAFVNIDLHQFNLQLNCSHQVGDSIHIMFKFQQIAWNFYQRFRPFSYHRARPKVGLCGLALIPFVVMLTRTQIHSQSQSKPYHDKPRSKSQRKFAIPSDIVNRLNPEKMILVLDLDETMIFSRREVLPPHKNYLLVDIRTSGREEVVLVQIRPHLPEFLAELSKLFTLYVYTAGTKSYADAVLDALPNGNLIQKRFYREDCIYFRGNLLKKLDKIRRKQKIGGNKVMVLIDDNKKSINLNKPYSILVPEFTGDQSDDKLFDVFDDLMKFYRENVSK